MNALLLVKVLKNILCFFPDTSPILKPEPLPKFCYNEHQPHWQYSGYVLTIDAQLYVQDSEIKHHTDAAVESIREQLELLN